MRPYWKTVRIGFWILGVLGVIKGEKLKYVYIYVFWCYPLPGGRNCLIRSILGLRIYLRLWESRVFEAMWVRFEAIMFVVGMY